VPTESVEHSSAHTAANVSRRERNLRMRPNRTLLDGPLAAQVTFAGTHPVLGQFRGHALDLSLHGIRVMIEALSTHAETIMLGERLTELVLTCGGTTIYRGDGTIVRTRAGESGIEVGIDLEQAGIDLDVVHRHAARQSLGERWASVRDEAPFASVSEPFRAWVSELGDFLGTAQRFLDREEQVMAAWDLATRTAVSEQLLNVVAPDVIARMNRAGQELHGLVGSLDRDLHTEYRAYLHEHLGALLSRSPFLHRARSKPLGYAGDYEMMNMLYRDHAEGSSLFGKAMNLYATQSPVAQANINRIEFLGRQILAAIERVPTGRVRIASIGCGPAQEIQTFLSQRPELGERLEVSLVDQEERAISYCERTLAPIAARTNAKIHVIRESVRRLLTDKQLGQALGQCQLIYSAGLFDYFNDRTFDALLRTLQDAVSERGSLIIGNVAAQNPNRWAMEYFTEWFLNHRSPEQLVERARALQPPPSTIETTAEPLGVNLFLLIER
jgi:extracellular factor (EF) 3-hydroxypalmitic acid methyl ester biosynthesis protein